MTKILYWNVNNFSLSKIYNSEEPQKAIDHLNYMLNVIFPPAAPAVPDIFVIVEVTAPKTNHIWEGALYGGSDGALGAMELLRNIRMMRNRREHNEDWRLVPPLCTGDGSFREAIAVYYNSANLQFVGPFHWCQVEDRLSQARPDPYPASPYPGPWQNCLPDRLIPAVPTDFAVPNAGLNENTVAGQWWWPDYEMTNHDFPDNGINNGLNFPGREQRKPFLTEFLDLRQNRLLRVYSIHTSPNSADRGVTQLSNIADIRNPSPDYTVDVIVGDFNVDSFNAFNGQVDQNPYWPLVTDNAFIMAFPPYDNPFQVNPDLLPVRLTHFLTLVTATPFNTDNHASDPTHNVYPRYGYMGSMGGQDFQDPVNSGAIDNIFTRYGSYSGGPAQNPVIINTVVGSPYNVLIPTYPQTLQNFLPMPDDQNLGGYPDPTPEEPDQFRQWNNFGKIRSVSDHLALVIDV